MLFETPEQVVRAAVVMLAIAALQYVNVERCHAAQSARTIPHVKGEQREYVYGPDYVDEFVCQIASEDAGDLSGPTGMNIPHYMLQDANYNVVALVRGRGGSAFPNGAGTVVEQWTYSPYGEVLASEWWHPNGQGPTPAEPNHLTAPST